MTQSKLSVQLYTVRELLQEDTAGTLKRLADLGFTQVEPFAFVSFGDALAQGLADAGLSAPTTHQSFIGSETAPVFEAAKALGIETVIDPYVAPERWTQKADIDDTAAKLNAAATVAADYGVKRRLPQPRPRDREHGRRRHRPRVLRRAAQRRRRARSRHLLGRRRRPGPGRAARSDSATASSRSTSRTVPRPPRPRTRSPSARARCPSPTSSLPHRMPSASSSSTTRAATASRPSPTATPSSPRRDSHERREPTGTVGVGVIGAGVISTQYLKNLTTFPDLDVRFVADIDEERARSQAAAFGVPGSGSVDELLADDAIEIVVNLTIPKVHVEVALQGARRRQARLEREAVLPRPRERTRAARRRPRRGAARRHGARHLPRRRHPVGPPPRRERRASAHRSRR